MLDIEALTRTLPERSADAVLNVSGFGSRTLRRHLAATLGAEAGTPGSFLASPVLEGAFPWKLHPGGWGSLPSHLHPDTGAALKKVMGYAPYAHQVEAWARLCTPTAASAIISSGTGSGKTECFLGAMLDHLLKVSNGGKQRLTGVRALMIYPLNALINSQQERLATWLSPYGGRLRYCLYNGLTPEKPELRQAALLQTPEQVYDRKTLRADPPPILVTNISMLEYMLVRPKDAAILEASQGTLEYIVLDEAHTYVGAAAAELSLLLRRVALAFGRDPDTIRVVATSATLGTGDKTEQGRQLSEFLAGLSGSRPEAVHAILGERAPLTLPALKHGEALSIGDLKALDDAALWDQLGPLPQIQELVRTLHQGDRIDWARWKKLASELLVDGGGDGAAQGLLECCARARGSQGERLLPTRLHVFQRTLAGLWACADRECSGRPSTADESDWPFGKVFNEAREACDACRAPVFEVFACRSCGCEALLAEEVHEGGLARLRAPSRDTVDDDFILEREPDEAEASEDNAAELAQPSTALPGLRQWIMPTPGKGRFDRAIRRSDGSLLDAKTDGDLIVHCMDVPPDQKCPSCAAGWGEQPALRAFRISAPFILGTTVPVAIASTSVEVGLDDKPSFGRRLITFTDARQGTARLAARLEADAERGFLRAFVYHSVQTRPAGATSAEIDAQQKLVRALELAANPDLAAYVAAEKSKLASMESGGAPAAVTWRDMTTNLAQDATTQQLGSVWREREPAFEQLETFANFLLLREFLRRAVLGNSAETMGFARLVLPHHETVVLPAAARALGLDDRDWRDFLRLIVTHFLRVNSIVSVAPAVAHWINRLHPKISVGQWEQRTPVNLPWPAVRNPNRPSRPVSLIAQAFGLPLDDASNARAINELLEEAHLAVKRYLQPAAGGGERLDLTSLSFAHVQDAWLCPVTGRILDTTLRGLSPYPRDGVHLPAQPIRMPTLPVCFPNTRSPEFKIEIQQFLQHDEHIAALRERGAWSDFHARAATFEPFFRSVEHSAQQPPRRLRSYEDAFKAGDINVLNCSTTMEMGVDIGSIEMVVNTNTPPSIASYRQRVGRAGRRDQPIAAAITLCKDRPLDWRAFRNPIEFLGSSLRAPRVSLDSEVIARRHANSLLLAAFMRSKGNDALASETGKFFGFEATAEDTAPWQEFLLWLDDFDARSAVECRQLASLLVGTPIAADISVLEAARDEIELIANRRRDEWLTLQDQANACASDAPAAGATRAQMKRVSGCYLLRELANEGFLPSYGFPTGVVPFVTDTAGRAGRTQETNFRNDDRSKSRDYPSRQLEVGLFEYAPGATVVLDGLAYRSGGLTLNWKAPASEANVREIQALNTAWRCRHCAAAGVASTVIRPVECNVCESTSLDFSDHIVPAGFTVDLRDPPDDETDDVIYVPRKAPWVHASGASWIALAEGGRLRGTDDGLVYVSNDGHRGHGYAVCLQCGRSGEELEPNAGGKPLPEAFSGPNGAHRPLRGSPRTEDGFCPGSAGAFSIKRNLDLGFTERTAVVEFHLFDCPDADTARAIAVALRESCAIELGIEPEQMGFAASPTPTATGGEAWCAVIYDRAKGGAGFAPTLADDPVKHILLARDLLNCQSASGCGDPEAARFCARCLLSTDVQYVIDKCDRKTAFEVLNQLAPRLVTPPEDRLLGPDTQVESSALVQALSRRLQRRRDETLIIWLNGDPNAWTLDEWPARQLCETWGPRGVPINLIINRDAMARADVATRQDLLRFVQRCQNAELSLGGPGIPGHPLAALASRDGDAVVWTTRDEGSACPTASWGMSDRFPVVRGASSKPLAGDAFDAASLVAVPANAAVVDVLREADGMARGFGQRLLRYLESRCGELTGAVLGAGPTRVVYSDRYLLSPLAAVLACELVSAFAGPNAEIVVRTLAKRKGGDGRDDFPRSVHQDWVNRADRQRVLELILGPKAKNVVVEQVDEAPHRRTLTVESPAGNLEVTLDQGVGSWRAADRVPFEFSASPERQAQRLVSGPIRVRNGPEGTFIVLRKH